MKEAQDLHRRAMQAAAEADAAQRSQDSARARHLFFDAFQLERAAARAVSLDFEPTRSILCRSAASLALDCELPGEALQLVKMARQGTPPAAIVAELDEIEQQSQASLGLLHRQAS